MLSTTGESGEVTPAGIAGIAPLVTPETEPFWSGAAQGCLVVERCRSCSATSHPPRGICRTCHGRDMDFVEITSSGVVYSFTVNYQRWLPTLEVPFAVVLVEFPDVPGVRIVGRLRRIEPEAVQIGMRVEVGFEPGPDGVAVPSFVAAVDAEADEVAS